MKEIKTAEEILLKHYSGLAVSDIVRAMEEYADQFKPKWVRVEDEEPMLYERIMVLRHDEIEVGEFINNGQGIVFDLEQYSCYYPKETITHWMKLPEKPKKDE